ncbi:MAG: NYN domain-containing protein, partial [Candidatus Dormibacteria bacterium]
IDMFLEAIDHEDTDTFVLMTGDADFVRMVATLRRRFGRKVIISGVQSTSTSLDLMNAADARDPITRQDVDLTGELGPMTRPLVTRADLEAKAEAAAAEATSQKGIGGIFGGLFRRKAPQGAPTQVGRQAPAPTAPAAPTTPLAPRRMRASEVRSGSGSTRGGSTTRAQGAGSTRAESASTRGGATAPRAGGRPSRGRTAVAEELPAVGPGTEPDEVERNIVREIYLMPPGRMGYTTIKTIEETLRSKAGQMGATRKEIPTRLQRLGEMGIFKREARPRGTGEVETGELVSDHPAVKAVTEGLERPVAKEPRPPRAPRRERGSRLVPTESAEGADGAEDGVEETAPATATAEQHQEPVAPVAAQPEPEPEVAEAVEESPAEPFRWVTRPAAEAGNGPAESADAAPEADKPAPKARVSRAKTTTARKPATARKPSTRSPRKKEADPGTTAAADEAASADVPQEEPTPG